MLIKQIGTRIKIDDHPLGPLTNLRAGGISGTLSEASKQKLRQPKTAEHKEKLRQASLITSPITNADLVTKEKIRQAHLGKSKSPEHKAKLQAHLRAKTNTPDQRARAAERARCRLITNDERKRIGEKVAKHFSQLLWIKKNNITKRIFHHELEIFLSDGWSRGRGRLAHRSDQGFKFFAL